MSIFVSKYLVSHQCCTICNEWSIFCMVLDYFSLITTLSNAFLCFPGYQVFFFQYKITKHLYYYLCSCRKIFIFHVKFPFLSRFVDWDFSFEPRSRQRNSISTVNHTETFHHLIWKKLFYYTRFVVGLKSSPIKMLTVANDFCLIHIRSFKLIYWLFTCIYCKF